MVQQPVMDEDEVEATQCNPSQQTQAMLDMIFEEDQEQQPVMDEDEVEATQCTEGLVEED